MRLGSCVLCAQEDVMAQMLAQMLLRFAHCLPEWQPLVHLEAMELNLGGQSVLSWDMGSRASRCLPHSTVNTKRQPPSVTAVHFQLVLSPKHLWAYDRSGSLSGLQYVSGSFSHHLDEKDLAASHQAAHQIITCIPVVFPSYALNTGRLRIA